jgi:hypothetical protein
MGLLFGLIFGIMDIEDASVYHIKQELLKEENYCIPIGLLLGAIAGFIGLVTENVYYNHYLGKLRGIQWKGWLQAFTNL